MIFKIIIMNTASYKAQDYSSLFVSLLIVALCGLAIYRMYKRSNKI